MVFTLNMIETAAFGIAMVFLGRFLRTKIRFLETFCIPAPVVGGLLFAVLNLVLHQAGILQIEFDETLKQFFMTVFFATVGFQADFHSVRKGGVALVLFVVLIAVLIVLQNVVSVGLASLMGLSPLVGMCTGSIPMVGGHGTAAAFGPILESRGAEGATAFATAAATFGLIAGSLLGGPVAKGMIRKFHLNENTGADASVSTAAGNGKAAGLKDISRAAMMLIVAMGLGSVLNRLIALTGATVPGYLGAMLVAAAIRNIAEIKNKKIPMAEIDGIASISLNIFLGIAMITLKLWELAGMALPIIILLCAQVLLMFLFVRFVIFRAMGRDYDAAVICSGTCGFGLGATPNALANMESVCSMYRYSAKAFLIVPLTGSIFVDFINAGLITVFLNLLP